MNHELAATGTIALIIPNLAGGGAERVMVVLANEFSARGIPTDLVILNNDDMHYESEVSDSVNLINLKSGRAIQSISSIRNYLKQSEPQAIISTLSHVSVATYIALLFSRLKNTKFFPREDRAPQSVSLRTPYLYCLNRLLRSSYKSADGVISLSEDMAVKIRHHHKIKTPIHTIYNPMYFDFILSQADRPLEPNHPWPSNSKFILGVGRLTPQKDFRTLIKALAEARKSNDVKLIILGEGPEREALMALAEDLDVKQHLYMPGFVKNPYAFMNASEFFVLSSILEGLPNALIQALICGTSCISTNCPTGPREILQDGALGTLVEVGDHKAIANTINSLLETPSKNKASIDELKLLYGASQSAEKYLAVITPD